ncbi:MAG: DUF736 family protein [Rhodospirillaceae bacterium]|nr:MAG: DUF736 family protein [Rhodospirillaceae bacterium]
MASGTLKINPADGTGQGRYIDLHHDLQLSFEPAGGKPGDNDPSHRVYVSVKGGNMSECGAAWAKRGERGRISGMTFYSFQIDDPSFNGALNLSAFPSFDASGKAIPGQFDVVWQRPRTASAAA